MYTESLMHYYTLIVCNNYVLNATIRGARHRLQLKSITWISKNFSFKNVGYF